MQKLLLTKDSDINKLTEKNISQSKEIANLKKLLNDKTPIDIKEKEKELEEKYKLEIDKHKKKNNDLELKIYNLNDKISKLEKNQKQNAEEEKKKEVKNENNDNQVPKNLYETLTNDYMKLKEQFELLKTSKNNELEEIKIQYEKKYDDYQNKLSADMKKKEMNYLKEKEEQNQKLSDKNSKLLDYENQIKNLNNTILNLNKKLSQFEKIIIKQEDNIDLLNKKTTENELSNKNTKIELEKKELEKNQLLNIIKEQKLQIKNIKENQELEDNNEINRLKAEILTLKSTIEVKNENIKNIQKIHKNLQEKYLKMCSEKRLKPQRELLEQAKEMRIRKEERNKNNNVLFRSSKMKIKSKKLFNIYDDNINDTNNTNFLPLISSNSNKNILKYSSNNNYSLLNDEEKDKTVNDIINQSQKIENL